MNHHPTPLTIILPGKLIDGIQNTPQQGMAIAFTPSGIAWIRPRGELDHPPADTPHQILEYPHSTLLPGLIDAHTHTNMPGDGRTGEEIHRDDTDDLRLLRAARNLTQALATGVTTLADCGSWNRTAYSLKQALAQGIIQGPRTLVSGPPLTITGGHLWFMGGQTDGIEPLRAAVRQRLMDGADFIKIAASGGSTLTSDPYRPAFTPQELQTITDEAHRRNLPVLAHCRNTQSINQALDAGVDAILHCFFADPDGAPRYDQPTADRLAQSGAWLNPTIHLGHASRAHLQRTMEQRPLTPIEQERWERSNQMAGVITGQFAQLIRAGVNLIGGSDCGWGSYPFGDYQGEIIAMHQAGLSPIDAIKAATRSPAAALRILPQTGTIQPGKAADLLLIQGDPTTNPQTLRQVQAVYQKGPPPHNPPPPPPPPPTPPRPATPTA